MRRRWIVAVVVAAVVVSGCDWLRPRFDASNSGANPVEQSISPTTVANLVPLSTSAGAGTVVVRGDTFYVNGEPDIDGPALWRGSSAFDPDNACGSDQPASCDAVWAGVAGDATGS